MSLSQSATSQLGRVSTSCGAVSTREICIFVQGYWTCRDTERCLIRRWELILSGCGWTSALARGATLAARWLHEPQSISNQSVGLRFPHPEGRYRPEGSAFSSPDCSSGRDMERRLTRGWELILPGGDGTSALARGAPLATRWLHDPQPISNHPVGLGFPHHAGRYRPVDDLCFRPPGC